MELIGINEKSFDVNQSYFFKAGLFCIGFWAFVKYKIFLKSQKKAPNIFSKKLLSFMHDFLPEFGRILATSKAKYLKKNSEIFSNKNIRFWPKNRPKTAKNAARKSPPGFRALKIGLRAGLGRPKNASGGRASGLARGPTHHYLWHIHRKILH